MTDFQTAARFTRRHVLKSAAVGAAVSVAAPAIATARKSDAAETIVGVGDHQYRVDHQWAKLPDQYQWQTTHNVAVDSQGQVYVIHEGHRDKPEHPSVFVFDSDGNYLRSFGSQFQGGGHGLDIRQEEGEDFLYVCAYQRQRSIAKLNVEGEQLWRQGAPMDSGHYAAGEDQFPRQGDDNPWGRDRFLPTNIAFHPDGGFYLADGYGAYRVHYYNPQAEWVSTFGTPSGEKQRDGSFNLPHGIWIDDRDPKQRKIVVADRVNARLQWFTMLGEHLQTVDGFLLPANVDVHGDLLLAPDLVGRVSLLDGNNQVIAHLGDDSERIQTDQKESGSFRIRGDESLWQAGKFIHPHDACFDAEGNIYVAEWVKTGRVTKLTKV